MRLFVAQLHRIEVDKCHVRCKDRAKLIDRRMLLCIGSKLLS